jgi:hypothetical protein
MNILEIYNANNSCKISWIIVNNEIQYNIYEFIILVLETDIYNSKEIWDSIKIDTELTYFLEKPYISGDLLVIIVTELYKIGLTTYSSVSLENKPIYISNIYYKRVKKIRKPKEEYSDDFSPKMIFKK